MLSDISQAEKDKYCVISPLYVESKKNKLLETETQMVVSRGCNVGGKGRSWSKGTNFHL